MATRFQFPFGNDGSTTLVKFDDDPSVDPDVWAYSRLFQPESPSSLNMNAWRSTPVGAGVNFAGFTIKELRATVRFDTAVGIDTCAPRIVKPGWSTIYQNQVSGSYKPINCLLTIGYMQYPPAAWPTGLTGPVNPSSNLGFHFFDDPIGARVPSPKQYLSSIWTAVMVWDRPAAFNSVQAPAVYDFSMYYELDSLKANGAQAFGTSQKMSQ